MVLVAVVVERTLSLGHKELQISAMNFISCDIGQVEFLFHPSVKGKRIVVQFNVISYHYGESKQISFHARCQGYKINK